MKTLFKKSLSLLFAGVLFIGCAGKDGAPGPTGAIGSTGAQGESGPTAKSYTFNGNFSSIVTGLNYTGLIGKVTEDDAVLIYLYTGPTSGVNYYTQLPVTFPNSTMPFVMYADLGDNGNLIVNVKKLDNSAGSPFSTTYPVLFKVIVIKGSIGSRKAGIYFGNYEEVKAYYNLQD